MVVMFDGFGLDYYRDSPMPTLKRWASQGLFAEVMAQMPTVTNTNNASICCGVPASVHGITGNSYLNPATHEEDFMEDSRLLCAPTLFEKASSSGLKSALLTSKKKTASLLNRGASLVIAAEDPSPELIPHYGAAPPIYSAEINHWLWRIAVDLLKTRKDLDILYVHTTDYPMHMHAVNTKESRAHLAGIDAKLAEAEHVAPDTGFYVTADHAMNHKSRAWDLGRVCEARGTPVKLAISAERDKYPKHHRGLGGVAYVYLRQPGDVKQVTHVLENLDGIEQVLTREEAAKTFALMPERIGDLVVTGDRNTVFGALEHETETLDAGYRSHGSRYEARVPLVIFDKGRHFESRAYQSNMDLTRGLLESLG